MLGIVGLSLKLVKFELLTPNILHYMATHLKRLAKRAQHVAPNNVAMCCIDMLRLFGLGFRILKERDRSVEDTAL